MTLQIIPCQKSDLETLQFIRVHTFKDTFGPHNETHFMDKFITETYNFDNLKKEFQNPNSTFYFGYDENNAVVGYCKLNVLDAQTESHDVQALEVECLYISPEHKRKGYGKHFLQHALSLAKQQNKSCVWLGVWEHNQPAIAFYHALGFTRTGEHLFNVGGDLQTDYIMTKTI